MIICYDNFDKQIKQIYLIKTVIVWEFVDKHFKVVNLFTILKL